MKLTSDLSTWRKLSEQVLQDYGFCQIIQDTFEHPSTHQAGDFIVTSFSDGVQIIAETSDKKLVLVNQFRFGSEKFSLELPAGRLEEAESPIDGAIRELREETGYVGENPIMLASLYINPAFIRNKIHIVKIENCQKLHQTQLDQFEDIETKLVTYDQLRELVNGGQITNCTTLSALIFNKKFV